MQNPESPGNTAWLHIVPGVYVSKALSENWGDSIGIQWALGRHLTWLRPRRRMYSFIRCWGHWGMWHWGLTLFYAISFSVGHMRHVQPTGPSTVNSKNCVRNSQRWIPTSGLETPMGLLCKGNPWFNPNPTQISCRTIFFFETSLWKKSIRAFPESWILWEGCGEHVRNWIRLRRGGGYGNVKTASWKLRRQTVPTAPFAEGLSTYIQSEDPCGWALMKLFLHVGHSCKHFISINSLNPFSLQLLGSRLCADKVIHGLKDYQSD